MANQRMSITEEILARNGGNKINASIELTIGLMRGDPATFKQGYSIGSALLACIDAYNLTKREIPLIVEGLPTRLKEHSSPTLRPLVIVHVGGGMVQWTHEKQGIGTPRVIVLDFDKEGADPDELREFVAEIERAGEALAEYGKPEDERDQDVRYTLGLARNEYQDHVDEGTQPSRYR